MITLFFIGVFFLVVKLICFAIKAAWGITKAALYIVFFPLILIGLVVAGLMYLAIPLLVIGLVLAFVWPAVRGI